MFSIGFRTKFNCIKSRGFNFSLNSPKPPIPDDIDGISKHRLSPIMPTLKHDNTHKVYGSSSFNI